MQMQFHNILLSIKKYSAVVILCITKISYKNSKKGKIVGAIVLLFFLTGDLFLLFILNNNSL